MFTSLVHPVGSHLVDEDGLVGCPWRRADVTVERCLTCRRLRGVLRDGDAVTEIRCEGPQPPTSSVLVPIAPSIARRAR
jgi:hypothetical protein